MRVDGWVRPALFLFGATPSRSVVTIDATTVTVRLGFFRYRVARSRIVAARPVSGLWWYGIGLHTDFQGGVAYNGSLAGMVELCIEPPVPWRTLLLPLRCSRLYVSLEEPARFIAALDLPVPSEASWS